jgi:hypothetical protein
MNKLLASAAFAALALASGSAYAADAAGNVDVGGTVPTCCTWSGGTGNVSLVIPNFVNSSAQVNAGNTVGKDLGTVTCSGPAFVRVKTTTGGLKNAAAPGAACDTNGNSTCVNYAAVAKWSAAGTPTATMTDSDGVPGNHADSPTPSSAASTGVVHIDVTPLVPTANPPLNAGSFTDVAVVLVGNPL